MEEVSVVNGQIILKDGEVPSFFFFIKEGKFRYGDKEYLSENFVGLVELILNLKMVGDVIAEDDGVIVKYTEQDLSENKEVFEKVLKYLTDLINVKLTEELSESVITDFEKNVDVAKITELISSFEDESKLLAVLEEMVSLQKLPELPKDPEKAKTLVEMVPKEEDLMRYILYRVAYVKAFPEMHVSKDYIMEVVRIYMDELDDKYGAKYVLKLALLFYPDDDEIAEEVLRRLLKLLRESRNPEWFEYMIRFLMRFPDKEVKFDEVS
jgi:hypothetical protein